MKAIRSIAASNSHRLPARLKLITTRIGSLILLFQRMPVVQFLFPEANVIGGAAIANTFSIAVTTVVGLGAYDSVSGQSEINQQAPLVVIGFFEPGPTAVATNAINVPATVSAPLTFKFNWDPSAQWSLVKSWRCTTGGVVGTLPAGLSPAFNADSTGTVGVGTHITISGTPTVAPGIYPVTVSVFRNMNYGNSEAAQIFNICVLGFSTQPAATTTISSGGTATLTCVAAGNPAGTVHHPGNGTLTYQWYRGLTGDMTTPVGTTNSTTPGFTTPALSSSTNYWVRIKSVLSTSTVYANSNTAAVTVSTPSVVSVAVSPTSVLENSGSAMVYTFTRTGSTAGSLTANYTASGTATAGTDYPSTSGTVTFAAASATATVSVTPTGDTTVESDETVILNVAAGAGYTADATAATGTITNDDTPFSSWASGLSAGQSAADQSPQGDGVTNLEKFAFNLNPLTPDFRHLTVGASGTAGLPGGVISGGVLRLEFLRRKAATNPGITYTVQFGSDLVGWTDIAVGTPAGTSIDATWERVVVDDPTGGTQRFGRVKVLQTP